MLKGQKLSKEFEMFAYCVNDTPEDDCVNDNVHENHLYKVNSFVNEEGFFPYGVRIADNSGNELTQTFHLARFLYMTNCKN